ncbi:MAG TPA: SpvB/TcaC N-terminal domain-containing protein [Xanthobacteraceae bacterium]|jgi:RHS repeat-associated protein
MLDRPSRQSDRPQPAQDRFALTAPQPSLPKGGGSIRGIGEKLTANPVTGTGTMAVPIFTSPGRSGFGPELSLAYDSNSGNGPFGLGWQLSLPAITRKTDKGLPQYDDSQESDVFILSGAEDLAPLLTQNGDDWVRAAPRTRSLYNKQYTVTSYRPRIEGLFARIERWMNLADPQDTFWRSISPNNVTSWYGASAESRIFNPLDPTRIFAWLICATYDDKGNVVSYRYKPEDSVNVDLAQVHERNRSDVTRSANRYIKQILYGNRAPYFPDLGSAQPTALPSDWCFEVVFDYGEHDAAAPLPDTEAQGWPARHDPFSSYRSTFEVRAYRRCQRALMFHHFPDETEIGMNCLVRSTDFTYSDPPADPLDPVYSFLIAASQTGYRRSAGAYLSKSLPPVTFDYALPSIDGTVRDVDPASMWNLPCGLDDDRYRWVDLNGEGASGILTQQGGAWFYKPNWSPANLDIENGEQRTLARFGPIEPIPTQPALALRETSRQQLLDLAGDGHLDLVEYGAPMPGFYERTGDDGWESFTPFSQLPALDWKNPNLKLIDVTGDGFPDLLISEDNAFWWHASLAKAGFASAQRIPQASDEEKGPKLLFADGSESIFLADMSGDGLTDIVRIRNGEVCYWPNVGYGHFGAKVTMDRAPRFEAADLFDGKQIRLADVDGSGTIDIIYLSRAGVQVYFNDSGNAWSGRVAVTAFPAIDNSVSIAALDLLGTGTACLVWSSPAPGNERRPMRYIDLMGGNKPHLLIKAANNLGAETRIEYAPSTKFYVADKLAGTPWVTRIPFPVHVVERVQTFDWISRNFFVTRYAYHHGYYDGVEREFRGFGMVEQWDTEEFATLTERADFPPTNVDEASHVPPVWTKTWFHTGAYVAEARISKLFAHEYYREGDGSDASSGLSDVQLQAMSLVDTVLPATLLLPDGTRASRALSADEAREASRALKGAMLHQETYALDGTDASARPYVVSDRNYTIEALQPQGPNRHAVFFTHARETIDFHYERMLYDVAGRRLADPRVSHAMTLDVDPFGNVLRAVAIGYGRCHPDPALSPADQSEQARLCITATLTQYTSPILQDDVHRLPLAAQVQSYELLRCTTQSSEPDVTNLFRFEEMAALLAQAGDGSHDLPYEDWQGQGATQNQPYRRLIERVRTLYRRDDLSGPLPVGQMDTLALPYESYKQAFTPGLLIAVYGSKIGAAELATALQNEGRYRDLDGDGSYWICSGRLFFSPDLNAPDPAFARSHFFLAQGLQDPFGNATRLAYDTPNSLLTTSIQDALDNVTSVQNDYRVLQPSQLTDPNGNRSAAAFDALGLVVGTAVMGKTSESLGDSLAGFVADATQAQIDGFFGADDPHSTADLLLGAATTRIVYDRDRFATTRAANPTDPSQWEPAFAATIAREIHVSDLAASQQSPLQISFSYSDGFGREIQKKLQAEPETSGAPLRWIGTGWTIFNNKGKPVRQYEPFFSALPQRPHRFEFGMAVGVSPILFYDPVERIVATLHPDHSWEKVVFDPWQQAAWDGNDTVLIADPKSDADVGDFFQRLSESEYLPTWYGQRQTGPPEAQDAAAKAAMHAGTPSLTHADALGRAFLSVAHNRFKSTNAATGDPPVEELYTSRTVLDIEANERAVIDALDRVVMRYDYDLLGHRIHQSSMEAGERWALMDVAEKPIYTWDSRDHQFVRIYDALQRPTDTFLSEAAGPRLLIGRTVYGEGLTDPQAKNQRDRPVQLFDQAGLLTTEEYDFKGNPLATRRQLAQAYKTTLDWSTDVPLETDLFTSSTRFDALNRPTSVTAPDGSVYRPTFNEANLIRKVDVNLRGAQAATSFVVNIDYNAKGQRLIIAYGNNVKSEYAYDPSTFRLISLNTTRLTDQALLQGLSYSYDPVGNITQIGDNAQQTIYFNNQVVAPSNDYTYDAIYRLINAAGREQIGQVSQPQTTWDDRYRVRLPQPGDGQAMRRYAESYAYDPAGNILQLIHQAANGSWTRSHTYDQPSLIEGGKSSNRLGGTAIGTNNPTTETYLYDAHGNVTSMPHLSLMQWDYRDQLQATSRHMMSEGSPEATWYVYDATGLRARKVTERQDGTRKTERIYIGGVEVYREYDASGTTVTLARETLHVADDEQRVALVETRVQGIDASPPQLARYQLGNHLGSASVELDDQAQVISYEEYFPYGSTSYQAVRSQTETPKRYRYTGMERDEESGFSYHAARHYAPWLGRWVSADPTDLRAGPNLYSYAANSPVVFLDSTGNEPRRGVTFPLPPGFGKPTQTLPPPSHHKKKQTKSTSTSSGAKKKGSEGGVEGGVSGGVEGGVVGGVIGGTGDDVRTGGDRGSGPGGSISPPNPGTPGGDPGVDVGNKVDPPTVTGQGQTPVGKEGGKPGGKQGGRPGGKEGGKPGGKEGGSKAGSPEGRNPGDSSLLGDLAALASLIADPESLYNAQQSGNTGKGAQIGSKWGIIKGWLAQLLVVVLVFGGKVVKAVKAIGGWVKKGINSLRNKLLGSAERRLLGPGAQEKLVNAFGRGADEAEQKLEELQARINAGERVPLPAPRKMLLQYRAAAEANIEAVSAGNFINKDEAIATQSLRIQIIDLLLNQKK